MDRFSRGLNLQPSGAFVCVDHIQVGWLSNYHKVGKLPGGTSLCSKLSSFFVSEPCESNSYV